LTVPLNPFKLVRTIEEVALAPAFTFWEAGLAEMEKSGAVEAVTVYDSDSECARLPLVPLTMTL